jgi:choline/glycine/proline betaine transport protein
LPFAVILCLMCYTVYLGLDNEYEILESEEFAERIQDLTEAGEMQVTTSGRETVTSIRRGEGEDAPGGD